MSMKRTKQRKFGAHEGGDDGGPFSFNKREPEPEKSWEEHVSSQPDDAFVPYTLNLSLSKGTFITHAKFGKGVVLSVDGARADVLFAEGMKKLSHRPV